MSSLYIDHRDVELELESEASSSAKTASALAPCRRNFSSTVNFDCIFCTPYD